MEKMTRNRLAGTLAWLGINRADPHIFAVTADSKVAKAWECDSNAVMELGVIGPLRAKINQLPSDHTIIEQTDYLGRTFQTVKNQLTGEEYERVVHPVEAYGTEDQSVDDTTIDGLAEAMKAKMRFTGRNGRDGWQECEPAELQNQLAVALTKGDPVDVANYCMMLFAMGEKIDMAHVIGIAMIEEEKRHAMQRAVVSAVFAASIDTDQPAEAAPRERTPEEQAERNAQFMGGKGEEVWD